MAQSLESCKHPDSTPFKSETSLFSWTLGGGGDHIEHVAKLDAGAFGEVHKVYIRLWEERAHC